MRADQSAKRTRYEEAVIHVLLTNREAIARLEIEPEWFYQYRSTILACKEIAAAGNDLDFIQLLEKTNDYALIGRLTSIRSEVVSTMANVQKYLDGLRDMTKSEGMRGALINATNSINNGEDIESIVSELMQSVLGAVVTDHNKYAHTLNEAMGDFLDHLEEVFEARDKGGLGLKTGIKDVDKVLGGMHPTDMIIVGARPGVGKTAFALSVLTALARQGKRVGFVSSEMSAQQVLLRLAAGESGISGHRLREADLADSDWPLLTAAVNKMKKLDIRIYDKPSITISDVALQSKAWAIDGGVDFICIDYLTRIKPTKSKGSSHLDTSEIAIGCKNIARTLGVPVMVLAQLNRNSANSNRRPVMSDLRESGRIEEEADQVLLLYRDEENESVAEVIVDKNRHGESKVIVPCVYDKQTMRWLDASWQHE